MNKIKQIIILAFLFTSSAQAELAWVKSSFWQTGYSDNQTLVFKTQNPKAISECQDFKDTVLDSHGEISIEKEEFQILRNLTDSILENKYSALFNIDMAASASEIQKTLTESNQKITQMNLVDSLRNDTLPLAQLIPTISGAMNLNVSLQPNSISYKAKKLGLSPQPVQIQILNGIPVIKAIGKDLSCDILSGQATLSFDGTAVAKISIESQLKLQKGYSDLEVLSQGILNSKKSARLKAILAGFRFGKYLEREYPQLKENEIEMQITHFVDVLFDEKMEPSAAWSHFENDIHLSVTGAVNTGVIHYQFRGDL